MLDIILDTLLDGVKLLPFLFIAFLIIEALEHKLNKKNKKVISKAGKFGPAFGSLLGAIPQCGFSVMATNLYATRIITIGTLIAIYLSTSDEMLPIMISEHTNILLLLKDKYDFEEEDFISAEFEIVPAGKARDLGLDKSMVIGYGQDDRICAYTSLMALLEVENVEKIYNNLKEHKYKIAFEIEENWYRQDNKLLGNKEFLVQDPDGYLLRFSEDLGEK